MARQEEPFVVQDRRRFSAEGDLTAPDVAESQPLPTTEQPPSPAKEELQSVEEDPMPTEFEQLHQHAAYNDAGKTIDEMLKNAAPGKRPAAMEVSFEGLANSLSVQAMMQLGVIRDEGTPMRPDIIGARQTIDILTMLQEKTKGNLSEREASMLQSALFELRMAFVEITKAVTQAPPPGKMPPAPGTPGVKR